VPVTLQNTGPAIRKQPSIKKMPISETVSLDRLIRDGPGADLAGALEHTRQKILIEGIKSDSDGMVRFQFL
jgi:cell cycle arrest protein BUB2